MHTTEQAVAATVEVARGLGVRVDVPEVLADGSNVLVHLRPAPVVARVATASALVRPGVAAWLARDIDLARYLHTSGLPVVLPCTDPPAGPHHHGDLVLSFWRHLPHDPEGRLPVDEVAKSLAQLHLALRGYPGDLPADGPLGDIRHSLDLLARHRRITEAELAALRADTRRLGDAVAGLPVRALHGDPHLGNVLATPNGLVWIDFEDTWRGPLGWDLASFADTPNGPSAEILAAYPEQVPAAELEICLRLRRLFAVCWRFVVAHRFPANEPNARFHLRAWLESESDGAD